METKVAKLLFYFVVILWVMFHHSDFVGGFMLCFPWFGPFFLQFHPRSFLQNEVARGSTLQNGAEPDVPNLQSYEF